MNRVVVVVALLTGCATRTPASRATCGTGWSPLTIERALDVPTGVHLRDATTIERVEVAGVDPHFAETLRREITTQPGLPVIDAPLGDDLRRLWKLGVIEDARIELDGGTVRFVVSPRPAIRKVVRTGGDALAQARFRQLEATSFEPSRVRRMTEALRESYVQEGRLDANVEARQRPHPAGVDVCVVLDPGPVVTVGKVEFPGHKALSEKQLKKAFTSGRKDRLNRAGGRFNQQALELGVLYLSAEYWDRGHAEVKVREPIVKRRGKHLDISIPIDEGPVYRMGSITMDAKLPMDMRRYIKTGDIFSRTRIADLREKIQEFDKRIYLVLPMTTLYRAQQTIDIHFEIEWRYPWDALRSWLSRSR